MGPRLIDVGQPEHGDHVVEHSVDALETHYNGSHQPPAHANAAAAELLLWLGFTDVQRDADGEVTGSTPETTPGFILTQGADHLGRCVALVGKGTPPVPAALTSP
ncbi:hypothetical protein [Streptomyces sp. NPDC093591]|uniref:hypothetical protein n=1 Tax=Streptomyces sp. NPDC093591 TaxID=3366044 RepID=UPI0037F8F14F